MHASSLVLTSTWRVHSLQFGAFYPATIRDTSSVFVWCDVCRRHNDMLLFDEGCWALLGLVLGNVAPSLRSRYLQQAHRMLLGCVFRFLFRFRPDLFFRNPQDSADLRIPRKPHLNLIIPGQE